MFDGEAPSSRQHKAENRSIRSGLDNNSKRFGCRNGRAKDH